MIRSSLIVFLASLLLTAIVGTLTSAIWRPARRVQILATFWGFALIVHIVWLCIPQLGDGAPIGRWLATLWLNGMLAGTCLLIPFGLLRVAWRRQNVISSYLPMVFAAACLLAGLILASTSTATFVVRHEQVQIPGLPAGLDGFRVANLGDVHIGYFIDPRELLRGIEALNVEKVDLIAVTGDLVDDVGQLESTMRVLETSNAPNGVVAILGNHEQSADLSKILSLYAEHSARIRLLVDQNITINRAGAPLHIVGVKYPTDSRGHALRNPELDYAGMNVQADAAFAGLAKGDVVIALSHHPAFFPIAAARGAQLTLASHTHGAQIRLFGRPIVGVYPFLQGPYQRGDSHLDVSAGFGHWLPVRFEVPREIVVVTLRQG